MQLMYKSVKDDDITDKAIFNKYIKRDFSIGLSTFRKWLGINVEQEKKRIDYE